MDARLMNRLGGEQNAVVYIADQLLMDLRAIEDEAPWISCNEKYGVLCGRVVHENLTPSDRDGATLKRLYTELKALLDTIGTQDEDRNAGDFFPKTYEQYTQEIASLFQRGDIQEGCEAAARTIIMGELPGGYNRVLLMYREQVRTEIIAALTEDGYIIPEEWEKDVEVEELLKRIFDRSAAEKEFFTRCLQTDNYLEPYTRIREDNYLSRRDIARLILGTRREIRKENDPDNNKCRNALGEAEKIKDREQGAIFPKLAVFWQAVRGTPAAAEKNVGKEIAKQRLLLASRVALVRTNEGLRRENLQEVPPDEEEPHVGETPTIVRGGRMDDYSAPQPDRQRPALRIIPGGKDS